MTVQAFRSLCLLVAVSLTVKGVLADIPIATNANTVAFYAITDNEIGTRFLNPNREQQGYDGSLYATNFSLATACSSSFDKTNRELCGRVYGDGYIDISDKVPGKYLFADVTAKVPMCDSYRSAHLVNWKDIRGNGNPSMWLNNFGREVTTGRSQWTLEWFVRNVKTSAGPMAYFDMNASGEHVLLDFPRVNHSSDVALYYSNTGEGLSYENNKSVVTLPGDLTCDDKWHHVALVYNQEPNSTDGTLKLYVDYVEGAGTVHFYRDLDIARNTEFRIRTSIGEGYVAAVRFSGEALTVDGMMRASDSLVRDAANRIAFYPLDEQPVGDVLTTYNSSGYDSNTTSYPNQIVSGYNSSGKKLTLMAKAAEGGGGVAFKSVADVPARYVYSVLDADKPMREPKTSLHITDGTNGTPGTDSGLFSVILNVSGLSKDLNTVSSWTLEWFAKYEKEPVSQIMYAKLWEGSLIQLNKKGGTHDTVTVSSSNPNASATVKYPDADYSLCDGKWHHIALVNRGGRLSVFCDYTLSSDSVLITQDASKSADEVRFGQGHWRGMLSCIRATACALDSREFMYASDSATGVAAATADWYWKLDGANGSVVSEVAAETDMTVDTDQYIFKDAHAFTGSFKGDGTAVYSDPLGLGHRKIGGVDCGKNKSAASLTGVALCAEQTGILCGLGWAYTAESMVSAVSPVSGFTTVMGARTRSGGSSWCLKLADSGALMIDVTMNDGSVLSRMIAEDFSGAAHHVAVRTDLLSRNVEVFVDYASCCAMNADDLPMPLVYGDELVLGGCGNANMSCTVDEVRVRHEVINVDDFIHFTGKLGMALIIR